MFDLLKNPQKFPKIRDVNEKVQNNAEISTGAVQRYDNLVDLEKCWKMRLLSLSEVSIQKRTSPDKFTGKLGIRDFEISFAISQVLAFELRGQVRYFANQIWFT